MNDAIERFRSAIRSAGLEPPEVIEADGRLHRFPTNGRVSDDAGWYVLHDDSIPAGMFGDFRTGVKRNWRADIGRPLTFAEGKAHRARMAAMRRKREADEARRGEAAKATTAEIVGVSALAAYDNPYLTRKRVSPVATLRELDAREAAEILGYAPKSRGKPLTGRLLVVPVKVGEELRTLEFIDEAGRKSALYGGAKAGIGRRNRCPMATELGLPC
jgi:putative DNA primase/helicase